jgi:hypothetical protein
LATGTIYVLPEPPVDECDIGRSPNVHIRLSHSGSVSRRHARLTRVGNRWRLDDLGSKNGVRRFAEPAATGFLLEAGMEIGIGNVTLVAEGPATTRVRGYLERVLGWGSQRMVNVGLQTLAAADIARAPVYLVGDDDLVAVARQLHRRMRGVQAPFVVCAPRARRPDQSLGVTATLAEPEEALVRATGGTVCIRAPLPSLDVLHKAVSAPDSRVRMIVCTSKRRNSSAPEVFPYSIVVPKLAARTKADLHRIAVEYAAEAIADLGARLSSFSDRDRAWVADHAASFGEVEVATRRLIARNDAGTTHRAAARLGLSHVGLRKWLKGRKF